MTKNYAVTYYRVSSHEQLKGTSLDSQRDLCIKYCQDNGLLVLKEFTERAQSGSNTQRREFIEMLDYCKEHKDKIASVVVWKCDRFARKADDHLAVRATLINDGITLQSVTEPLTDTPTGRLLETILAAIAQFDNEIRRERSINGTLKRLEQGIWPYKTLIGYSKDKRGILTKDKNSEFIVRSFDEYSKDIYSTTELANMVNSWGMRTVDGKKISEQYLYKILTNQLYMGWLYIDEDIIQFDGPGIHEPIISKELFFKVQAVLQRRGNNTKVRQTDNEIYPLKNIMVCGVCNKVMTASARKATGKADIPYYHCKKAGHSRIQKKLAEKAFVEVLDQVKPKVEVLAVFKAKVLAGLELAYNDAMNEVIAVDKELNKLRKEKQGLVSMRAREEIGAEEFIGLKNDLSRRITVLEMERSEVRSNEVNTEYLLNLAETFFKNLPLIWREVPIIYKKKIQKLVFPEGIVVVDSKEISRTPVLGLGFNYIDEVVSFQNQSSE